MLARGAFRQRLPLDVARASVASSRQASALSAMPTSTPRWHSLGHWRLARAKENGGPQAAVECLVNRG
jgi:hypothetical protein